MADYILYHGELYHYGVPGMKWGIRRSRASLSSKAAKLRKKTDKLSSTVSQLDKDAKTYERKSTKINSKNDKWEAKLSKASAAKSKYELKYQKALNKKHIDGDKIAKYAAKSAKYNKKVLKAEAKLKYNKWSVKAQETKIAADKARAKLEKKKKVMRSLNSTISALDEGKIKQGRLFMQYARG